MCHTVSSTIPRTYFSGAFFGDPELPPSTINNSNGLITRTSPSRTLGVFPQLGPGRTYNEWACAVYVRQDSTSWNITFHRPTNYVTPSPPGYRANNKLYSGTRGSVRDGCLSRHGRPSVAKRQDWQHVFNQCSRGKVNGTSNEIIFYSGRCHVDIGDVCDFYQQGQMEIYGLIEEVIVCYQNEIGF